MTPTAFVFLSLVAVAFPRLTTFRNWKVTCPRWYYEGRTSENPIGLRLLDYLLFKKFSTTEVIQVAKRVNITVLYEALSNSSVYFMKEHVAPVFKYLHQGINLELIPYGRTTEDISEYRYEFTCPNGEKETIANKIHACAMYFLAKRKKHTRLVEVISCLMGHSDHKKALSTCCSKSGVQSMRIRKCAFRHEGSYLLARKGERNRQWISNITEFPAVVVDGVFDEAKNAMALNDLWSFVCTEVPEVCRPKPPPTTRYVRTTTKKVKRSKKERKLMKKTLLDKYNKSLDYAMKLAKELWEYKYQKMAAMGCTTTARPSRTTTIKTQGTTSILEYAYSETESESEASGTDEDVSKSVSKSASESVSKSASESVSKSASESVSKKITKKVSKTSRKKDVHVSKSDGGIPERRQEKSESEVIDDYEQYYDELQERRKNAKEGDYGY